MASKTSLQHLVHALDMIQPYDLFGEITDIQGMTIIGACDHKNVTLGSSVRIEKDDHTYRGEVVALKDGRAIILLATPTEGLSPGDKICYDCVPFQIAPSDTWKGRVLNAFAMPYDDRGDLSLGTDVKNTKAAPLPATKRLKIKKPLDLGVRSLNAFTTVCQGQRLGIFSGSGIGKSVLLSMLVRFAVYDVCVIGLIGERGREVREFIEDTLGESGMRNSVVVLATSDEPPLARRQSAYTTLSVAEHFRDQGLNVLCIIDSLTRFAMAQREIGLSAGEPPTTKGYPPSTFFELARLCERAGPGLEKDGNGVRGGGTITGLFSVLVDGDDHNEPISDAVRGILDGHVVLERSLAERSIYPAVNVLRSMSRLARTAQTEHQQSLVIEAKKILSTYNDMVELIRLGAYREGSNPEVDRAISLYPFFEAFLKQRPDERTSLAETFERLESIVGR